VGTAMVIYENKESFIKYCSKANDKRRSPLKQAIHIINLIILIKINH